MKSSDVLPSRRKELASSRNLCNSASSPIAISHSKSSIRKTAPFLNTAVKKTKKSSIETKWLSTSSLQMRITHYVNILINWLLSVDTCLAIKKRRAHEFTQNLKVLTFYSFFRSMKGEARSPLEKNVSCLINKWMNTKLRAVLKTYEKAYEPKVSQQGMAPDRWTSKKNSPSTGSNKK